MTTDQSRKITIEEVGSLVLHGTDQRTHTAVLNALAAADEAEIVGLLMGTAYGEQVVISELERLDDPRLKPEQVDSIAAEIAERPWPGGTTLEFGVPEHQGGPGIVQEVTFDLEPEHQTLGAVMALVERARQQAPAAQQL